MAWQKVVLCHNPPSPPQQMHTEQLLKPTIDVRGYIKHRFLAAKVWIILANMNGMWLALQSNMVDGYTEPYYWE